MLFVHALLTALAVTSSLAAPLLDRRDNAPIRGVNIGGWLVLEPYIKPSFFEPYGGAAVGEWTFCQNVPDAEAKLQEHWSTWVTPDDFGKIAGAGFNLVRIPIGYWAFAKYEDEPYIQGAADYLEKAIGWARDSGLKVWIDLHGAPRSQNGFDNSGHRTPPEWTTGDSVSATEGVIGQIVQKYASGSYNDVVVGIELLNEPLMSALPGGRGATQSYYQDGFNIVRQAGSTPVVFQEGFAAPQSWNGFLSGQATIDHHEYQCFETAKLQLDWQGHVGEVWSSTGSFAPGLDKPLVVGEWTAAMTDCAKWLNGYGIGARYDGTYNYNGVGSYYIGSCAGKDDIQSWDDGMRAATTNFIQAQISAYESQTAGWIFWNFKTESAGEWGLFGLLDNGIWPS